MLEHALTGGHKIIGPNHSCIECNTVVRLNSGRRPVRISIKSLFASQFGEVRGEVI